MRNLFYSFKSVFAAYAPFALVLVMPAHQAPSAQAAAPRRIEITAKRFEYTPSEITLKKGEPAVLVLKSEDVGHGLLISDLHIEAEIAKDHAIEVPVTPEEAGTFTGQCSHFCGAGHGGMTLTVHVTE